VERSRLGARTPDTPPVPIFRTLLGKSMEFVSSDMATGQWSVCRCRERSAGPQPRCPLRVTPATETGRGGRFRPSLPDRSTVAQHRLRIRLRESVHSITTQLAQTVRKTVQKHTSCVRLHTVS
jgi:hypothetical protein